MRKLLLLFVGLIFFTGSSWAQEITIGTGNINKFIPISPDWNYTYSQMIYLQSEIDTEGNITALQFYYNSTPSSLSNSNDWDIYLGHTDKTFFQGGYQSTDWVPTSAMTKVFSGIINGAKANWITINLDIPFAYNNVNNLVIAIDENKPGFNLGDLNYFHCTETPEKRSIRYVTDGTNPNPNSPPGASGTVEAYANVKLTIGSNLPAPIAVTNIAPANNATGININGEALSWQFGANTEEYQVKFGTSSTPATVVVDFTSTLATSYALAGLTYNTTYYWQVNAKNAGGTTAGPIWSFTTAPQPAPVAVTNIAPVNNATSININGEELSWAFGANTNEYQLMFGTNSTPATVVVDFTSTLATTYALAGLTYNTTYYWQVNAKNAGGTTAGPVWSFTTAIGTGINNPSGAEGIHAYTYGDVLYLETATTEVALVNVYDITGQLVMQGKTSGNNLSTLNTSALSNGIYVVNVVLNNGIVSRKISIKK